MHLLKSQASALRFLTTHAAIYNTFYTQRHFISLPTLRSFRAELRTHGLRRWRRSGRAGAYRSWQVMLTTLSRNLAREGRFNSINSTCNRHAAFLTESRGRPLSAYGKVALIDALKSFLLRGDGRTLSVEPRARLYAPNVTAGSHSLYPFKVSRGSVSNTGGRLRLFESSELECTRV